MGQEISRVLLSMSCLLIEFTKTDPADYHDTENRNRAKWDDENIDNGYHQGESCYQPRCAQGLNVSK